MHAKEEENVKLKDMLRRRSSNLSSAGDLELKPEVFDEAGTIEIQTPKKVLGEGAFGQVLLGTFEGVPCAVKRFAFT